MKLFRRDFNTPGNILMGEERTSSYEKACELKYYQACHYKKWTDDRGLSDLQLAGDFWENDVSLMRLHVSYLDGRRAMSMVIPHRRHPMLNKR